MKFLLPLFLALILSAPNLILLYWCFYKFDVLFMGHKLNTIWEQDIYRKPTQGEKLFIRSMAIGGYFVSIVFWVVILQLVLY
jgi:hypothetical protein